MLADARALALPAAHSVSSSVCGSCLPRVRAPACCQIWTKRAALQCIRVRRCARQGRRRGPPHGSAAPGRIRGAGPWSRLRATGRAIPQRGAIAGISRGSDREHPRLARDCWPRAGRRHGRLAVAEKTPNHDPAVHHAVAFGSPQAWPVRCTVTRSTESKPCRAVRDPNERGVNPSQSCLQSESKTLPPF
jgi:hypothetical protein